MNKKTLLLSSIFFTCIIILVVITQATQAFSVKKEHNRLVIRNTTSEHYPGVAVTCKINKKSYRSSYKFIPGNSSLKLSAQDFSDEKGDTLSTIQDISNVEISGGDSLIDESVHEDVLVQ